MTAARAADVKHLFCCYKDDRYFRAQLPEFTRQFTFIEYLPTEMAFPVAGRGPSPSGRWAAWRW